MYKGGKTMPGICRGWKNYCKSKAPVAKSESGEYCEDHRGNERAFGKPNLDWERGQNSSLILQ